MGYIMKHILTILLLASLNVFAENSHATTSGMTDAQLVKLIKDELTRYPKNGKQFVKEITFLYPTKKQLIVNAVLTTPGINPPDILEDTKLNSPLYTVRQPLAMPAPQQPSGIRSASPN